MGGGETGGGSSVSELLVTGKPPNDGNTQIQTPPCLAANSFLAVTSASLLIPPSSASVFFQGFSPSRELRYEYILLFTRR